MCDVCPNGNTCNGIEHSVHGETAATLKEFYGILDPVRRLEGKLGM